MRRLLAGALAAAVVAAVALLVAEDEGPDYEGIRGCTLPSVAPDPVVAEGRSADGADLVVVSDIPRATVVAPWIDDRRLLVGNRDGFMWLLDPTSGTTTEIVDLSDRIVLNAEGGLIGAAVAPDGEHLYVHHTDLEGTSRLLEFGTTPDGVDLATERTVLTQRHPGLVHNGGALAFGPDGFLYLGFGDGGGRPADADRVASLEHLDGKILRIDPRPSGDNAYTIPPDNPFAGVSGAREEIWATGLRNPYRFAFDPVTGDLWIGDVGETCYEELNLLEAGASGADLGFPRFEGTHEFLGGPRKGAIFPVLTYTHDEGCAVIAGVVVRDPALPWMAGQLLYGDYCGEGLRWVRRDGSATESGSVGVDVAGVQSFGVGPNDEVYVLTAQRVLQLVPRAEG